MRNQKHRAVLGIAQQFEASSDQRDIRDAFVGMAKHLNSRPQPRAAFDEVAAGRAATPGWALIRASRACLDAAATKGTTTLRATRAEVESYYDTLKAIALRGYDEGDVSPELALVTFAREGSEAHAAVTRLAVERTPVAALECRREVREAMQAGARVLSLDAYRLTLTPLQGHTHVLPMGVVR